MALTKKKHKYQLYDQIKFDKNEYITGKEIPRLKKSNRTS